MNKYQREKAKRMKKLANLGIGYHQQKAILRDYSFEQIDNVVEQITKIKKTGILEKVAKVIIKVGLVVLEHLIKVTQENSKENKDLDRPDYINLRG